MKLRNQLARLLTAALVSFLPAAFAQSAPSLTPAKAAELIKGYRGEMQGKVIASMPTAVSAAPQPLDSMGPMPIGEECFAAWQRTLGALVREGYLSGYLQTEHVVGLESRFLTAKGRPFFGALYPQKFHTNVMIVPRPAEADLTVTGIHYRLGPDAAIAEIRCRPCGVFAILWEGKLLASACKGSVDPSLVLDNGDIRGHAHLARSGGRWRVLRVELGEHTGADKE
jgi:hypothetical protein